MLGVIDKAGMRPARSQRVCLKAFPFIKTPIHRGVNERAAASAKRPYPHAYALRQDAEPHRLLDICPWLIHPQVALIIMSLANPIRSLLASAALFCAAALGLAPGHALAQGTLKPITFNGAPDLPPGSARAMTDYYEDTMNFTPINPGGSFTRSGGGISIYPENNTEYVFQGVFSTIAGSRDFSLRFGLYSVQLAEFSTFHQFPQTVRFIGYRTDGNIVTTEFTTDGIIDGTGPLADFQTFYFDSRFSDLLRFEVPTHLYAMDNIYFYNAIPEPGAFPLLTLGAGIFCALRLRAQKSTAR